MVLCGVVWCCFVVVFLTVQRCLMQCWVGRMFVSAALCCAGAVFVRCSPFLWRVGLALVVPCWSV